MEFNIRSKQFALSILAGAATGIFLALFLRPLCWGTIASVFIASYFAKVSSPKEGAIVGAIVLVPIGIFAALQLMFQPAFATDLRSQDSLISILIAFPIAIVLMAGIGAVIGLIVGKLFQVTKDKNVQF